MPEANIRSLWWVNVSRLCRESGAERKTHKNVKSGETTEPCCAALAPNGRDPFVVGERQRIQIPHQQSILYLEFRIMVTNEADMDTHSPK